MRRRYRSSYVSVDVDLDEVFGALDNDDLIAECENRGIVVIGTGNALVGTGATHISSLESLLDLCRRGETGEAVVILEQLLRPKWKSLAECEAAAKSLLAKRDSVRWN